MTFHEITVAITNKHSTKLVMIGIEGYGGSGKSTVAKQLAANLSSAWVVNIDDFIVKEN